MTVRNHTWYLARPNSGPRIKRSLDVEDYYRQPHTEDEEYLEVAANVVFERLRRSIDDNEIVDRASKLVTDSRAAYDLIGNGVVRPGDDDHSSYLKTRVRRQAPSSIGKDTSGDLNYKQFVFDDVITDPTAQTIDFRSISKQNRPADVLEYKRFLKVSFVSSIVDE